VAERDAAEWANRARMKHAPENRDPDWVQGHDPESRDWKAVLRQKAPEPTVQEQPRA